MHVGPFIASAIALVVVLGFAVVRPRGLPEAVVAVPAAALLLVTTLVPWHDAEPQLRALLPVVGFLAAILALAQLCADDGLFRVAGELLARRYQHRAQALLVGVFVVASITTAVLSLDATVVLLTPVVFAAAAHAGARPRPHVFACTHLANSASLLLPVSNLTNLLVFASSGLSFARFAALMALPWVVSIVIEYVVVRQYFRSDLAAGAAATAPTESTRVPRFTVAILGLTLVGFVVSSALDVNPAWAAFGGALILAVRAVATKRTKPLDVVRSANPQFCAFVLALGVIVQGVVDNGLGQALNRIVPDGSSLWALLLIAVIAAVLANLINNLPAVLAMLPVAASMGVGPLLAVLIGVNLGPNLTYVGSLATLLWRRIVHEHDGDPGLGRFTALGVRAVPATLLAATVALWAGLQVIGT